MTPLETYLTELRASQHAAVRETSYYGALANLFNEVGQTLKPKVRYVITPKGQGAGLPDGGLYTAQQLRRGGAAGAGAAIETTPPERGCVEAKGLSEEVEKIAAREQVEKYLKRYGQTLVTNYRDFLLVGRDEGGRSLLLERYTLAASEAEFWAAAADPKAFAREHGERFEEYLKRVMLHAAPLAAPEDVARFLASYARDARARMEKSELPALASVRGALEEALGLRFVGADGEHFFRSTLVQTLFYGVFSAWVLWTQQQEAGRGAGGGRKFNWKDAAWTLRVPMISALFEQLLMPSRLQPLGLVEVLDWAGMTLNRIADPAAFIRKFTEGHAVQYFYEPFLQEFDPELRKQLGVWYTPSEIVKYMVARVDTVLREELNVADGLANEQVYVLDPCCGTGAYLVEVLRRIEATLRERGEDATSGEQLKQAAMNRVFGFEILPAPFVVAHLQLGLLLQSLDAPLADTGAERVGVFLTNALTGWEPAREPKTHLLFPELEEERDRAEEVKRERKILVVIGNPPYNGYAGVAIGEERTLTDAYRTTIKVAPPEGSGLNNLFVRFFRVAERRIVELTGAGVVCFISPYSWLKKSSFPGMRERYLEVFDQIWIDSLNGDRHETGKLTPDGKPDPSVFSTEYNREGIQVGTAISTFVRKEQHEAAEVVHFREWWGVNKRAELLASQSNSDVKSYESLTPPLTLGLPFMPMRSHGEYQEWPLLPDLFPVSFPGVKTSRDDVVVDIDRARLVKRMEKYFDQNISHEEMRRIAPGAMENSSGFKAEEIRDFLRRRGFLTQNIVRFLYRPMDARWLYWEPETKLLDRNRSEYFPQIFKGNIFLFTTGMTRKHDFEPALCTRLLNDLNCMDSGARGFPLYLAPANKTLFDIETAEKQINITDRASEFLTTLSGSEEDLFYHCLCILHSPVYRLEHAAALRQSWPRVPLPASAEALRASAALGRQVAAILAYDAADPDAAQASQLRGITHTPLRAEMRSIGVVSRVGGGQLRLNEGELALNVNWGFAGQNGVMPGRGKTVERDYTPAERAAVEAGAQALGLDAGEAFARLGARTLDVYLNDAA
ncbi:MAG TPA: type ISP restriction/modification enzyme, partial [Pyrinomonadaceae bacterium]|nr:type ISP restriction/modification enzyme [Pyrinomonadaceae bacterium]